MSDQIIIRRGWLPWRSWRGWPRSIWVLLGLMPGATAGWWAGSWSSACANGAACEPRWEAVSAIGTWAGGIGTVGALLIAGSELLRAKAAEHTASLDSERARRVHLRIAKLTAGRVGLYVVADQKLESRMQTMSVQWANHSSEVLRDVVIHVGQAAPLYFDELEPGSSGAQSYPIDVPLPSTPDEMSEWSRSQVQGVSMTFTLEGERLIRRGESTVAHLGPS